MNEKELLKNAGCENIEYYMLVNNDGFKFFKNDIKYDLRHVVNCYGADCDYYALHALTEGINLYITFNSFEKALNYIKGV